MKAKLVKVEYVATYHLIDDDGDLAAEMRVGGGNGSVTVYGKDIKDIFDKAKAEEDAVLKAFEARKKEK